MLCSSGETDAGAYGMMYRKTERMKNEWKDQLDVWDTACGVSPNYIGGTDQV